MEVVHYIGGCSVHRGKASVLWRLLSTVGDSFSTVQYSGGGGGGGDDNISTCGG